MRAFLIAFLIFSIFAQKMAITKEYVDYLKKHVDWEVEDYETNIFRGWTEEEFNALLGYVGNEESEPEMKDEEIVTGPLPSELSWRGDKCIHEPRSQGSCGSCWAFAATAVLSDRCCMAGKDWGWLAPQELVSCDKSSHGCQGGYLNSPFNYFHSKGLVQEKDFPYKASNTPCNVKGTHHCKCQGKSCQGDSAMKNCVREGPTTYAFKVCQSFRNYKSGIYKCDCTNYLGGHAVEAVGYGDPCHWVTKNSWGTSWGDHGYFKLACGTCQFQGGYTCKPNPA